MIGLLILACKVLFIRGDKSGGKCPGDFCPDTVITYILPIHFRASFGSLFCLFQTLLFHYVHWLLLIWGGLTTNFLYNKTIIHFVRLGLLVSCLLMVTETMERTS